VLAADLSTMDQNTCTVHNGLITLQHAFNGFIATSVAGQVGGMAAPQNPASQSALLGAQPTSLSSGTVPTSDIPTLPSTPTATRQHTFIQPLQECYKPVELKKFTGEDKGVKLKEWLTNVKIYCLPSSSDMFCLCSALSFLDKEVVHYMREWKEAMANGRMHSTWLQFEHELEIMYWDTNPISMAHTQLDAVCKKQYNDMTAFVQDFRQYAVESAYSNANLIKCIKHCCPEQVAMLQASMELNSNIPPKKWQAYLQQVVDIDRQTRDKKAAAKVGHTGTLSGSHSKAQDAMDVDAMQQKNSTPKVDLSTEKLAWHMEGKCHSFLHPYFKLGSHDLSISLKYSQVLDAH
jgi:hypothetical protein